MTQARALAGLSKADLAGQVGVSAAAIGQYEAGITSPRPDVVDKLAEATSMKSDFFNVGRPLARINEVNAHFRSLRSARVSDRQKALATATLVWELTFALERYVRLPEVDLPEVGPGTTPAEAAALLRRHWKLPDGPVRHLTATAESHGVVVVIRPLAEIDAVDAFSLKIVERPIIVMTPRRSENVFRHRFSIAHEIGHLLLHDDVSEPTAAIERDADEFAAAFLTPATSMDVALPARLDLAVLDRLGRTWGVSSSSLVRRMVERGRTTESSARRAYQRLARSNDPAADPTSAYPGETPSLLKRAAELAGEHGTTIPAISEAVRLNPSMVRGLLGDADHRPVLRLV
ncbi:ImmA/IrrE family metallo-endopeptidase [Nocardioides sp.]|uniref:XRE family transcriptional regulator n=1 Tax=Nocardioides sp. TaxID=35761 RepID=UPI00262D955E|nr:ImmA/IrrE family metallo-endopeptidase [Nocardioides sp.]